MILLIPYINLLNLCWIKKKKQKKMSIFEEYGAFKSILRFFENLYEGHWWGVIGQI